jgi:gluconolactonase
VAAGFNWSEGPVWRSGAILFSDVPENVVYRWEPGMQKAAIFLEPSGLSQPTPGFREQGSNGLALGRDGSLLLCQHGDRRIARLNADGRSFESVADRFNGKRFNSPNDLVVASTGDIYFTDPPYGLQKLNESPLKELSFNGVFRVSTKGEVTLLDDTLSFPNGIGLSPDERILYVAVSDSKAPRIMAYDLEEGKATNKRLFFDAAPLKAPDVKGGCDGLKVDEQGNVWATGPGGVLVISPAGKHLGTILTGQATANCGWGEDGSVLYICADMYLVRVKTLTRGAGWDAKR